MSRLEKVSGFNVLPLTLAPLKHSNSGYYSNGELETEVEIIHEIFYKPHVSKKANKDDLPLDRCLFLVNLPVDTSQSHLARLFRNCGVIERIAVSSKSSGACAHIVFEDVESIDRAMEMKPRKRGWTPLEEEPLGLKKWIINHVSKRPDTEALESKVTSAMSLFDQAQEEARIEAERKRTIPDADGFVTVTRSSKGRRNVARDGSGATVMAVRPDQAKDLKPKKKELKDFYRFQIRETKRDELADLRKKFEEDKAKVGLMKANNRFKPY